MEQPMLPPIFTYVDLDEITDLLKCDKCTKIIDEQACTHVSCGATYCEECLYYRAEHDDDDDRITCCDNKDQDRWLPITGRTMHELNKLTVYCPNRARGCKVTMSRRLQFDHKRKECKFESQCNKCHNWLQAGTLPYHIKNSCKYSNITCPYCEKQGQPGEILKHADNILDCVSGIKNLVNHPLIKSDGSIAVSNKRKGDTTTTKEDFEVSQVVVDNDMNDQELDDDKFIVAEDHIESESDGTIKKNWKNWRGKKEKNKNKNKKHKRVKT